MEKLSDTQIEEIKCGNAILLFGAGASISSSRFDGKLDKILTGAQLAEAICKQLDLKYNGERLKEVYDAAIEVRSLDWVNSFLVKEYSGLKPSVELEKIFSYCWRRIYTLNIDDTLFIYHTENVLNNLNS